MIYPKSESKNGSTPSNVIDGWVFLSEQNRNTVGPVEGNLDVEVHAGDLRLDVVSVEQFGSVDASTRIGDLDTGPFKQQQKGWLGHHMRWQGSGTYDLHAHVGTGDLVIAAAPKTKWPRSGGTMTPSRVRGTVPDKHSSGEIKYLA